MKLLRRSISTTPLIGVYLLIVLFPVTRLTAHSAESTQIVVKGGPRNGRPSAIQLVEIVGGTVRDVLRANAFDEHPICLPNGKGIAFLRNVRNPEWTPKESNIAQATKELFVLHEGQKEPTQITFGMNVRPTLSASPDGEQLVYVSNRTNQLHVVRIGTRESTQLTSNLKGGPKVPVWSPDGRRIAFAYYEKDSYQASFYVLDTTTRQLVSIPTPSPATKSPNTWSPWSPDGTKLALGGVARTIIVDVSREQARVTREVTGYLSDVHWSPDGTKLAFTDGAVGTYCDNVYVMDLQRGVRKRVNPWFREYRCFHAPRWSPDSKHLAFLGYFSRGDMTIFGPDSISDQLYVADGNLKTRRLTEDLKERNIYGISWCAQPLSLQP